MALVPAAAAAVAAHSQKSMLEICPISSLLPRSSTHCHSYTPPVIVVVIVSFSRADNGRSVVSLPALTLETLRDVACSWGDGVLRGFEHASHSNTRNATQQGIIILHAIRICVRRVHVCMYTMCSQTFRQNVLTPSRVKGHEVRSYVKSVEFKTICFKVWW